MTKTIQYRTRMLMRSRFGY